MSALAALIAVGTVLAAGFPGSGVKRAGNGPVLGVLLADPAFLAHDTRAGVRLAVLSLDWARWEPRKGHVDAAYRAETVAVARRYRAAGWKVAVDLGLQQPPGWVLAQPGGRLVDQHGGRSSTADFEFSEAVRRAGARYIVDAVHHLGAVADYRVGLSQSGETLYPSTSSNQWWAFVPQAQGEATGLPKGVQPTPLPGWVPGSPTWQGRPVTEDQVRRWYEWYLGALVNAHAWEIATYRAAGYRGQLELVMPGTGALPDLYRAVLAGDLAHNPGDCCDLLNAGAVWWRFLDELPDLRGTAVDVSSVYDQSGSPRGNGCEAGDERVHYRRNPGIDAWSDTRWLTYLARRHGLPVMGENPGYTPSGDLPGIMHLVRSCHLVALQWAWDYQLRGDGNTANLAQLSAAFKAGA